MYRRPNKYDFYIITLIALLAFGEFGGALQLTRVAGICFMPALLSGSRKIINDIKKLKKFVLIVLSWCVLSLLWTGNAERGLQEIIYYFVHLCVFLEVVTFSLLSNKRLFSISMGWAIAVLGTAIVAVWELKTGLHLPYCRFDSDLILHTGFIRRFAAATFFNFNDYEVFLCYSLPFLFVGIGQSERIQTLFFFFAALLAAIAIILFNASRGATVSAGIICTIGLTKVLKNRGKHIKILVIIMVALFIITLAENIDTIMVNLIGRMDSMSVTESSRTEIWGLAFECLVNTLFMGTGIAGVEKGMSVVSNHYLAPHNMFIEIAVEFGLVIFIYVLLNILKMLKFTIRNHSPYKKVLYATFFALPFIAIISSKYLLCVDLYVFFGSLYVLVYNEKYSQTIH